MGELPAEVRPGLTSLTSAGSLVEKLGAAFGRDFVVDGAVRPDLIVFVAESASEDLRFEHAAEQFAIEAFVAKAAVAAT